MVAEAMSPDAVVRRPHGHRELTLAVTGAALVLAGGDALWLATHVHLSPAAHRWVLLGHLAMLVVGFGAVLAVDWVALLWALRRRSLADVLAMAATLNLPIWSGYAGLMLTGILLSPDTSRAATVVKLGLALGIGLNGLLAAALHHRLASGPGRSALVVGAGSAAVSQVCWWGATVIGFLNAH